MPLFLLIIPAYREGKRLPVFAERLLPALERSGLSVAVQVVDDGSPPEERMAMEAWCERLRARWRFLSPLLSLPVNTGKGGAVYAGWDTGGEARWLGFCDADGSVPAPEVVRLMQLIAAADDPLLCVVASRRPGTGRAVRRSWQRRVLGAVFSAWARACTGLALRDTQCGCKFLPQVVYQAIRPELKERRFVFDVELLAQVGRHGATLREAPVD